MKRPLIEITIDKTAVLVGVLALILLMHVIIGWRFHTFENQLESYNRQLEEMHDIDQEQINQQAHLRKLIEGNLSVNWEQTRYLLPLAVKNEEANYGTGN